MPVTVAFLTALAPNVTLPNTFYNCCNFPFVVKDIDDLFYSTITTESATTIQERIEAGKFDVTAYDQLALVIAVLQNKIDVLKVLVKRLNAIQHRPNDTVLIEAIGLDNAEAMWMLLKGFEDETDWYIIKSAFVLSRAHQFGSLNVADLLLAPEANMSSAVLRLVLRNIDESMVTYHIPDKFGKCHVFSLLPHGENCAANRETIRARIVAALR